jgi:beta-mannosidase
MRKPLAKYGFGDGAHESKWLRKAQFSFGWDWAPRLINCGIWRPVRLEFLDAAVLRDVWVRTRLESDGSATVTVVTEIENLGSKPQDVTLHLSAPDVGEQTVELRALPKGVKQVETAFRVARPQLWWPRPLGEAVMHTLQARLAQGAATLASREVRFGIREIRLLQESLAGAADGKTFTLLVNGEKVFANGANWAPPDCIVARVTPEKYDRLLTMIRDANLNMLRVWGGGIFEDERFYRFCDDNGILLWHDFMMACFIYPGDDAGFRDAIAREVTSAVRLLRNHPSIAIWCGSNETDWAFNSNWYPGCEANTSLVLEHELIPGLMKTLDPDRIYRPTSPWGGKDVNDEDQGDQHWWAISIATGGNDTLDYRNYRRAHCTFNSEYGYFGMPELATMREYLPESELRVDSELFRYHVNRHGFMEKGQRGKIKVLEAIDLLYGNSATMSLEELIEASQLLQADALKTATEQARRRKFDCGGTMFWMFPDAWGEVGWSVVDYYLRKKASYYYIQRACAPVLVSIKEEECGVSTWVVNDTRAPVRGVLERRLVSFDGKVRSQHSESVEIAANASLRCALERMTLMRSGDFYVACLKDGDKVLSQNIFFFMNFKSVKMLPAKVALRVVSKESGRAVLELGTDVFAHYVHLVLPAGLEPEDNFFDLLPGESRMVGVRGDMSRLDDVRVRWNNR